MCYVASRSCVLYAAKRLRIEGDHLACNTACCPKARGPSLAGRLPQAVAPRRPVADDRARLSKRPAIVSALVCVPGAGETERGRGHELPASPGGGGWLEAGEHQPQARGAAPPLPLGASRGEA